MNGNKKRVINILLGLCAGLVGFALVELVGFMSISSYLSQSLIRGAVLGGIFGFTFGFTDGFFYKELKSGLVKAGIAAVLGGLTSAAALTLSFQGVLWSANFFHLEYTRTMDLLFPLWRSLGWMMMGMAIGIVDGLHQRTLRRVLAGLLGGFCGGLLGGLSFEFLVRFLPDPGIARAVGFIVMGVLIGLFLGEFEVRFAYARLRVLNGELKDREYLLIKNRILLGGNHRDDIFLHGYGVLSASVIMRNQGEVCFSGSDPGVNEGVLLINDHPQDEPQPLKYQDVIQTGRVKLLYMPL